MRGKSGCKRLAALAMLGLWLAATPVRAGYNEGLAALQKNDFPLAIKELTPAAKAGNTLAQVRLAEIYFNGGNGVDRNIATGMEWLRKAAAGGNVDAVFFLGQILLTGGLGQTKDVPEAVRLLELLITKANDQRAMALLAPVYLQGAGVAKNEARAVALYRKLGELGNGAAWRVMAGLASEDQAGLSKTQIVEFLKKAIALGDVASHLYLGQLYLQGVSVAKDEQEGVRLVQLAADGGDFNAMMILANLYLAGAGGLGTDNQQALKWLSIVLNRAPQGDVYFQASMAAQDVRKHMSSASIARAQEEAGKWQARSLTASAPAAHKP